MYYLIFDCETTGLLPNCNVLTACFLILNSKLEIIKELYLKIKHPHYIVFTKALEINKINLIDHDNDDNCINKNEAYILIEQFIKQFDTKYIIMGHNINFDINMLKNNELINDDLINKYFDPNYLDTYTLAKKLKINNKIPKYQSLSLSKLNYYFNSNKIEEDENYHNAKYDCYKTLNLYKCLKELD